eukprot:TRINITY_DN5547_c0_g4_i1.p2 TRINITY_DN5547_c0_g4~~TRINITY_DN5547_c0_g4_i1.p2  ORF type:complete len:350 (+),score=127.80 TRINITY_DN5547_c0_g4_i1:333-1382(+)
MSGSSSSSWSATASQAAAPLTYVDESGFILSAVNPPVSASPLTQQRAERESRRIDRWVRMVSNWPEYAPHYAKIKRRVRAGVPDCMRGYAWQLILGSRGLLLRHPGTYQSLLQQDMDPELREIAKRDLGRTFTTSVMFLSAHTTQIGDDFQQTLYRILHAYAVYDPRVGYCQGMGFLAATLLSQMKEEEAFWAFTVMMRHEKYLVGDMYLPGFPKTQQAFRILTMLLERFAPRLAEHLEMECVNISYFASRWFMTLFANVIPTRRALQIWDVFFVEGWKIMFRVAVALLVMEEESLLGMDMEDLLTRLKTLHEGKDVGDLIALANTFKITNTELRLLTAALEREAEADL